MIQETLSFCGEGVGSSGKSHVMGAVQRILAAEHGLRIQNHKLSGMGPSPRTEILRSIKQRRDSLIANDPENPLAKKYVNDNKKDRIMRLVTWWQVKLFLRERNNNEHQDIIFFDRSPITLLTYTLAAHPDSPHLDEIRAEVLQLFALLPQMKIFLFDLLPEITLGRALARAMLFTDSNLERNEIMDRVKQLTGANNEEWQTITQIAEQQMSLPGVQGKRFAPWDYLRLEVKRRERMAYLSELQHTTGITDHEMEIVDASKPIDEVVNRVLSSILNQ